MTGRGGECLSIKEHRRRIEESEIAFGSFSWDELNLREYEALMFDALLLRPDNSHMDTWPNIFHDQRICIFCRWDFDDLEEKVLHCLGGEKERRRSGAERLRDVLSPAGMERFSDWLVHQIEF